MVTDRRNEDRRSAEGEDEERRAETERRGEELREAWRRRRKPQQDPLRRPGRDRKPEDDGKGRRWATTYHHRVSRAKRGRSSRP